MSKKIRRDKVISIRRSILKVLAESDSNVPEGCAAILHVVTLGMSANGVFEDTFELEPNVHVTVSIDLTEGTHDG